MNITRILKTSSSGFLILFFFCCAINAQKASFEWSEWIRNDKSGLSDPILALASESGFVTYSIEKGSGVFPLSTIFITSFDASCSSRAVLDFKLPNRQQRDATLLKVIEGDGVLYFFSALALKKEKRHILFVQVYDAASEQLLEAKELAEIPIERLNNSGFFEVEISKNKAVLAVLKQHPFIKKTKENISVLVYDAGLNLQSSTQQTLEFASARAYKEQLFVANSGYVHIVKKTGILKKKPITSVIQIKDDEALIQQVSSEGFYISDSRVIDLNGKHYLVGYATDSWKPTVSMGGKKDKSYFIYDLTDNKLIKNQSWSPDILKKVLGKGFLGLSLKEVLIKNEQLYLVGDCLSVTSELREGSQFDYDYTYHNGPGIIVKLDVSGHITMEKYHKYSYSFRNNLQRLGSFDPVFIGSDLYLMANEKQSVLEKKDIVFGYRNINAKVMVLKKMDGDENAEVMPLDSGAVGGKEAVIDFAASRTLQLNEKTFYIYAYGQKYQAFGKMILE